MPEMILPGVYIEVRPEGLIVPGQISVGNVGVVGTASRGPIGTPTLLGSYAQARQLFGDADAWDKDNPGDVLTLVRALELAFTHGATTVYAVRVAGGGVATASRTLPSATGNAAVLRAKTPGDWGESVMVNVGDATASPVIEDEEHVFSGGAVALSHQPVAQSARARISITEDATGIVRHRRVIYAGVPGAEDVLVTPGTGALTFGTAPANDDVIRATYLLPPAQGVKVTVRLGTLEEVYTVVDGADLVADINDPDSGSALVTATAGSQPDEPPTKDAPGVFAPLQGGDNGVSGAPYKAGLDALLTVDAHIVIGAGQTDGGTFAADLAAHVDVASTDTLKRDRIGVVGSRLGATLDQVLGHSVSSDRVVFVAPGMLATDAATGKTVTLPGAYTAAAIAGKLASLSPHISLTNKTLPVAGLEQVYTPTELTQLVKAAVVAVEKRQGYRVVKGITSSVGSPFSQITTRRIVDYAKYGVRSAATPYIGLLNNERVRGAMHATINTFLDGMVKDEMLTGYQLAVTATREEERQGIARVTLTLRPTFSIDYIKVTMFLE